MGLASILLERGARSLLNTAKDALDADKALQRTMGALIDSRRREHEKNPRPKWRHGDGTSRSRVST